MRRRRKGVVILNGPFESGIFVKSSHRVSILALPQFSLVHFAGALQAAAPQRKHLILPQTYEVNRLSEMRQAKGQAGFCHEIRANGSEPLAPDRMVKPCLVH